MDEDAACLDSLKREEWDAVRKACAVLARSFELSAVQEIPKAAYFKKIGNGVSERDERLKRSEDLLSAAELSFKVSLADASSDYRADAIRTLHHPNDLLANSNRELLWQQDRLEPTAHRVAQYDGLKHGLASILNSIK
jgi:hypothetical protein